MRLLFDFLPILLFFAAYKFAGIYTATVVAMAASALQVGFFWLKHRTVEKLHVITLILIVFLGGATLILHDPIFIKWKPTLVNWAFALVFLGSHFIGKQPILQRLMSKQIQLSQQIWNRLSLSWVCFFTLTGAINIYVAYAYDTDIWVNFKLFGMLGLTVLFIVIQAIVLARYAQPNE